NRRATRAGDPESADSVRPRLEGARAQAGGHPPPPRAHPPHHYTTTQPRPAPPRTPPVPPATLLLPNPFFAAYAAVAARLNTAAPGAAIPAYQGGPITLSVLVRDTESAKY